MAVEWKRSAGLTRTVRAVTLGVAARRPWLTIRPTVNAVVLESTRVCPRCGVAALETMPMDACQYFYERRGCRTLLRPKLGDCCVFCSFGSVPCPTAEMGVRPPSPLSAGSATNVLSACQRYPPSPSIAGLRDVRPARVRRYRQSLIRPSKLNQPTPAAGNVNCAPPLFGTLPSRPEPAPRR
jgi:hypothetical protein